MTNPLEKITELANNKSKLSDINLHYYNKSSIISKIIYKYLYDNRVYFDCEIKSHIKHPALGSYQELYINYLFICKDNLITLEHIDSYIKKQKTSILFNLIRFNPFIIPQINIENINQYNYE